MSRTRFEITDDTGKSVHEATVQGGSSTLPAGGCGCARDEARKYWKALAAERPDDNKLKSLVTE